MKKIHELLQMLEEKKIEMKALLDADNLEEAQAKNEEIKKLKAKIEIQKSLEEEDDTSFENKMANKQVKNISKEGKKEVTAEAEMVAFNKAVLCKPLAEGEAPLVKESVEEDGGVLVPKDIKTKINELKRDYDPLKKYCDVVPVGTKSGSMPVEKEDNSTLINFDEGEEINQSAVKFGKVEYNTSAYGDIIPVANTFLQDVKANFMRYVNRKFARKAVRTENKKIIDILKSATKITGTNEKDINTALNKKLKKALRKGAVIVTNSDGLLYLDNLVDKQGRSLVKSSIEDENIKKYKGKQIVVVDDDDLESPANKLIFIVVNMTEFVKFFDREVYEVAVSKEAGFTKNVTYIRCIERLDVKKGDAKAGYIVEIPVPTEESASN